MRHALPLRAGGFSSGNRIASYFKLFSHARPIRVLVTVQIAVPPTFLDVEAWRDSLLAVSGQLDTKLGGENVGLNGNRRTVYAKVSRHELDELLRLFDFPDANVTSEKRTVTTVPQQQLFMLNSSFMVQQATALSKRLQESAATDKERIEAAFPLLFSRPATEREVQIGLDFLTAAESDAPGQKIDAWQQYAQALLSLNEFMYID